MDVYNDKNLRGLYQILLDHQNLMPMVKQANLDPKEASCLPNSAFAWPVMREFRIDTPEHAALSWAYMQKQANDLPGFVKTNIENALAVYNVDMTTMVKTAAEPSPDEYLFPEEKRYRVHDKDTYKLAHNAILKNYERIPWEQRTKACVKLAEKAMEFDEDMDPMLLRQAGLVSCDLTKLSVWIRQRALLSEKTKPELTPTYDQIADGLTKVAECSREDLIKMSSALRTLDKASGVDRYYGTKLPDPIASVFNTDKFAEESVMMAGRPVPISRLLAQDPQYFADALGADVIPEITTDGELDPEKVQMIFRTLPMDIQQTIVESLGL